MKKKFLIIFLLVIFLPLHAENNMIFVEGGEMEIGASDMEDNYLHIVEISDFYISKNLVNKKDFLLFLKDSKLNSNSEGRITDDYRTVEEVSLSDNCPAQGMTWLYAVLYCNWLSEKEGLTSCYEFPNGLSDTKLYRNMIWNHDANGYRLPTEAEWEYAARGGQLSKGYKYPGSNDLNEVNKEMHISYEIGQMKPNELGIHDMGGLVSEYCYDWYDEKMWEWLPKKDPCFEKLEMRNVNLENYKCYRGADWHWSPKGTYSWRFEQSLDGASTTGIRLVRSNMNKKDNIKSNSKSNYAELEGKKSKDVNLVITKDGSIHVDGINIGKEITPNSIMQGNTMNLHYIGNGKINDFKVRCRSESNLQCETLFLLDKNQKVKIIDRGEKKFLIDGEDWYWYYIETESGKTGWVYGKYLDIEK